VQLPSCVEVLGKALKSKSLTAGRRVRKNSVLEVRRSRGTAVGERAGRHQPDLLHGSSDEKS